MQNKTELQYKIKLFQECFSLCSVSAAEDFDYCKKKSTYCTILFSFLLLGFGLLQWNTKLALVFEIQTFHSLFFPIQFPRLYFTSRHLRQYIAASACYECCLSSHYQLPKNQLSSLPDDKAIPSPKLSENS